MESNVTLPEFHRDRQFSNANNSRVQILVVMIDKSVSPAGEDK